VGLVIETIIDIAQDHLVIQKPSHTAGVIGSGIVSGRAVDIIDSDFFIQASPSLAAIRRLEEAA
jgi:two-component system chemotaxis sensor kinase CheA